jgi:hypothetical protein
MEDRWGVLEADKVFQMSILIAEELLPFRNPMDRVPNINTEELEVAWEVVLAALILTAYSLIHKVIKRIVKALKEASAPQEVGCKVQEYQEVQTSKCPRSPTRWLWVA